MKITSIEKEPLRPQNSERGKRPSHLIEGGMVRNAGCYIFIALYLSLHCSLFQHMLVVEQEMLYYASAVMGQSLMKNMQGKNEIRREALICFVNACRYLNLIHFFVCEELVAFSGRRPPLPYH